MKVFSCLFASVFFVVAAFSVQAETETVPGTYDFSVQAEDQEGGTIKNIELVAKLYDIIRYTEYEKTSAYIDTLNCRDEGDPSLREDVWSAWDIKNRLRGINDMEEANAVLAALNPDGIWGDVAFNWNEFSRELALIERERELYGLWERVASQNVQHNAEELGFLIDLSDIGIGDIEDDLVGCEVTRSYEQVYRPVEKKRRKHLRDDRVRLDIDYSGFILLSDESEKFRVVFDGQKVSLRQSTSLNSTRYSFDENSGELIVTATGRTAKTSAADFNVSFSRVGADIVLSVQDKRANVLGSNYEIEISGSVEKDPKGCGKSPETVAQISTSFQNGSGQLSLATELGGLEDGASYWIKGLQVSRANTDYFTGSFTLPDFDRVKFKN